jgi:hypothetical protein
MKTRIYDKLGAIDPTHRKSTPAAQPAFKQANRATPGFISTADRQKRHSRSRRFDVRLANDTAIAKCTPHQRGSADPARDKAHDPLTKTSEAGHNRIQATQQGGRQSL